LEICRTHTSVNGESDEKTKMTDNPSPIKKYVPDYHVTGKVCPVPIVWNNMYNLMLKLQRVRKIEEKPPHPLVLHGWYSSDEKKKIRFSEMIEYSEKYNLDTSIQSFINKLSDDDWFFGDPLLGTEDEWT